MNIKKALLVTLSTSLIATTLLQTNYVNAEEGDEQIKSENTSKATVNFSLPAKFEEAEPLNPRNPDDAENVDKDDLGNNNDETGPLTLDRVKDIEFGNLDLEYAGGEYESETEVPYIQITDLRGPGSGGWNVTAKANPFTTKIEDEEVETLYGSQIHFIGGEAVSKSENPTILKKDAVKKEIVLDTAEEASAVPVVSTDGGTIKEPEGLGSWIIRWWDEDPMEKESNVTLVIPEAAASSGDHETLITWTLTDGPGFNETESESNE